MTGAKVTRVETLQLEPGTKQLRININEYNEKLYFDLRTWFKQEDDADYIPTKKGINLPIERLSDVEKIIGKAIRKAQEMAV